MERIPDHPVITAAERYGYPKQPKAVHQCSVCDEPIYEGEMAYNIPGYGWICEHCADMHYEEATA